MSDWTYEDVNLAGIYTILVFMVGVCYMMCDPIGGGYKPAKQDESRHQAQEEAYRRASVSQE